MYFNKKFLFTLLSLFISSSLVFAAYSPLTVEESDGSPSIKNVKKIIVSNATLSENGSIATVTTGAGEGGGAPTDAHYVTTQAESGLSAEVNLGALTTGLLKNTVSKGVATISKADAGTDYLAPNGSAANLTNFPTLNQNTTGTASNLSGTPALPNGTTATTQSQSDNSTKLATTAYVDTGLATKQATVTAGRSLTFDSTTMNADAELYTDTKCIYIQNPVDTDDLKSIWFAKTASTVTSLWCESDQTVTAMLQVDDGSPADVDSVDLTCDTTPPEDTSLNGDATLASGDRLDLDIASTSGTPTWVSICWTTTKDD
jgi:hypothetical protein